MATVSQNKILIKKNKRLQVSVLALKYQSHPHPPASWTLANIQCLVGKIIKVFEQEGFCMVAMTFLWLSEEYREQQYIDLKDCSFFPGMEKYMNSSPIVAIVCEGLDVVKIFFFGDTLEIYT
uniref:nucleoside-diphosphate kinase n=1 Tax=Sus scrofa TaxID=9823 RepID=A0A5G2QF48_PIG